MMRSQIDPLITPNHSASRPPTGPPPFDPGRRRRRPLRWLAPLAVLVAAAVLAIWVFTSYDGDLRHGSSVATLPAAVSTPTASGSSTSTATTEPPVTTVGATTTTVPAEPGEPTDADEDALAGEEAADAEEPVGDAPLPEPEPQPGVDVPLLPTACHEVLATGASLLVTPDPLALEPGDFSGHVTINNCSGNEVDWWASTTAAITFDTASSSLPGGATTLLGFTIDANAYEPGALEVELTVIEPTADHVVHVSAFRNTLGKDLVPPGIGLTAGDDAGGCASQCITQALVHATNFSSDVSLAIKTNVPARLKVFVSTHAPQTQPDGYPYFPGVAPIDQHFPRTTAWTAELAPLEPGTKYFVIVKATDVHGHSSYRAGKFRTVTPYDNPDGLSNGAVSCAGQCISEARVHLEAGSASPTLSVESNTPAAFAVWVSTEAPHEANGVPSFGDLAPVAVSGDEYTQEWAAHLGDLAHSTEYHIVVRATDAHGHRSYRAGTFATPAELHDVLIEVQVVHIIDDGDRGAGNRGEIRVRWGVSELAIGTIPKGKVSSATNLKFDRSHTTFIAHDLHTDDFLPAVQVAVEEFDADGLLEWCPNGTGVATVHEYDAGCDSKTNVAGSGLIRYSGLDHMTRCDKYGNQFAGDFCLSFNSPDEGDDYANFSVVVSFTVLD